MRDQRVSGGGIPWPGPGRKSPIPAAHRRAKSSIQSLILDVGELRMDSRRLAQPFPSDPHLGEQTNAVLEEQGRLGRGGGAKLSLITVWTEWKG